MGYYQHYINVWVTPTRGDGIWYTNDNGTLTEHHGEQSYVRSWTTTSTTSFSLVYANYSGTWSLNNYVEDNYSITVSAGTGGTIKANKTSAKPGDTVTLTVTPSTGYQFSSFTKTPSTLAISNNKFTMPSQNVTITANFTKKSYTITKAVSPSGSGSVAVTKSGTAAANAQYGDSLAISQTASSGYVFKNWTSSPANLPASSTAGSTTFTMPAQNVTITANYYKLSTGTLSKTSITGGETITLTITALSTAYSHKYQLSFGTGMETEEKNVAAGTSTVNITVPVGWSAQIPNATSKTGGSLTLKTYSGSTLIGSTTITGLTYNVPSTVVPTIGTISTSIARTIDGKTYANVGNLYVQNHCGVQIQTSGSGAQNSTITSMKVALAGYSGTKYNSTISGASVNFTTGLLSVSGTNTITITATDSRGRTASKTATISVSAYSAPTGSLAVRRVDSSRVDDDMGIYGMYTLSKSYSSLGGANTLTWTLSCSGSSASSPANSGDLLPNSRKLFNETQEYTVTLTLTDLLETKTIRAILPSVRFIMAFDASGNKIGIMKYPNKDIPSGKQRTFEFSEDTQIYIGNKTLEQYITDIING